MGSTKEQLVHRLRHFKGKIQMNHFKKVLVISTLFASCVMVNMTLSAKSTSEPTRTVHQSEVINQVAIQRQYKRKKNRALRHQCQNNNLGLTVNKQLSIPDAKIIIQAALLQDNRPTLRIGNITTVDNKNQVKRYKITIVDSKGQVSSTILFNSATGNYHPIIKNQT